MATIPITWQTPLTNAVINGSGHLEKNAGIDNCGTNASGTGDAGARSVESIASGDFIFECKLGPAGDARTFVGLTDDATYDPNFANWQAALHLSTADNTIDPHPPNSVFAYLGGPPRKTYQNGVWQVDDIFRFVVAGGQIRYYLNCLFLYASPITVTYPVYAIASMACIGSVVRNPIFRVGEGAGVGGGGGSVGPDTGDSCSGSWSLPSIGAFPLSAAGGPQHAYFQEVSGDWREYGQRFPDGKSAHNTILSSPIRRFICRWDGLTQAEAATLDAHFHSTRGGLKFTVTHPRTAEVVTGVRYRSYRRSAHRKIWSQAREAELVKYAS